ncbi:MAG: hypothetical protein ACXWRE_15780, partial [Pseudobdellovibrionaceae bacterium]
TKIEINKKTRNSTHRYYEVVFLVLFAVSCNRGHRDNSPAPVAPPPPVKTEVAPPAPPSVCETLKAALPISPNLMLKPLQSEHIERHFQRVLRHDCAGNLVSDKIETVYPPQIDLKIKNISRKPFKGVLVFNEETCNQMLTTMPVTNWPLLGLLYSVTGNGKDQILIKGDLSPAWFTFQLSKGTNHLFVRYYHDCLPSKIEEQQLTTIGTSDCETSENFTTVEHPIEISYSEKTLDGSLTRDPSPEECAQEEKQKAQDH